MRGFAKVLCAACLMVLPLPVVAQDEVAEEQPAAAQAPEPLTVWAAGDIESLRFLGDNRVGPRFDKDAELEVILEADGRYRVRGGDEYGWVAITDTTTTAPLPKFDLGSLNLDPSTFGAPQLPPPNPTGAGN